MIILPKILNLFIGFVVGVVLMFLPKPYIFIVSDVLNSLSGGDLVGSIIQGILDTLGLILVCIFGYKIVKLAYKN